MKYKDVGKRFRFCRRLIDKTIDDLSKTYNIGCSTLTKWESGALAITTKNISKIIRMLNAEGLICSEEWLLYGTGVSPSIIENLENIEDLKNLDSKKLPDVAKHIKIFNEVEFFKRNNKNSIVKMIVDDAMSPFYRIGDYVGGVKIEPQFYDSINHKNCIIILPSKRIYIRQFFKTEKSFILLPFQTSDVFPPIILENQFFDLYLISYHRIDVSRITCKSLNGVVARALSNHSKN